MTSPRQPRRSRRRAGREPLARFRRLLSRALPFAFAGAIAAAVALLVVLAAGGSGADDAPAAAALSPAGPGETVAPAAATSTAGGSAAAAATADAGRAQVLALGQRIVRPEGQRVAAPPLRVQTASFGDGSLFDLEAERGKVVILYFTAAWCPSCIAETKALARIQEAHAGHDVRILALDVDANETERDLAAYRERTGGGAHLWAFDRDFVIARDYGVRSLGATVFIDREGRIAYSDASPTTYETLDAIIEALLP